MNGGWDYVRAMAYGPSQGEYWHDVMFGPFGALQPGDVAISPNLQKKYPLGSYITVSAEGRDPFFARVADHSYYTPGNPTKDTIELWNGQDLGHVNIRGAPAYAGNLLPLSRPQMASGYAPATAVSAPGGPQMSTWADYNRALMPTTGERVASGAGSALLNVGSSLTQSAAQGSNQALAMLKPSMWGQQLINQLAANPYQYLSNPYQYLNNPYLGG